MRTRRTRRLTGALLATALVLAACGSSSDDDTAPEPAAEGSVSDDTADDTAEDTSTDDASADDGATRTVTDYQGREIEVPAEPMDVIGMDNVHAVELLALGITPAAASENFAGSVVGLENYLPEDFNPESLASFGQAYEPDIEALAALEPDLIVGNEFMEDSYGNFSAIAPTVLVAWPSNGAWQQRFRDVAEAVGRTDEADAVEADFAAFVDALPDGLDGTTVAFVRANTDGSFRMDTLPESFPGSVAEQAGIELLQPADVEVEEGADFYDFSGEQLGVLQEADLLVVADFTTIGADDDSLSLFDANPLWQELPAVQNGNVAQVPGLVYNGGNYFAAKALLDALAELLA